MKILKLTTGQDSEVLINFQNVSHVLPNKEGCIIYTVRVSGYDTIYVHESLAEIMQKLEI